MIGSSKRIEGFQGWRDEWYRREIALTGGRAALLAGASHGCTMLQRGMKPHEIIQQLQEKLEKARVDAEYYSEGNPNGKAGRTSPTTGANADEKDDPYSATAK